MVTQEVDTQPPAGGWKDAQWLTRLDVIFAGLYFTAIAGFINQSANTPSSWNALFESRFTPGVDRIQFALAGMNAHINHDLCLAINATCKATNVVPRHGTAQYNDYTSINPVLAGLIDQAKQNLEVRLPGDQLPDLAHLEDLIAAWDVSAARETAWNNAEHLWNLPPLLAESLVDGIDGFTTVISKTLLVPVP